jgi:hydrogenase maturation protein HypF
MENFAMCARCGREYGNPDDRRFHAQPIACPDCGPNVWLESAEGGAGELGFSDDPIARARSLLLEGKILAIKGIGGFHLACNATDAVAVQKLRERKGRYQKAFALMGRDMKMVERYCWLGEVEKALLASPQAPIVLLKRKKNRALPDNLASGLNSLGFMLPYTPLHHLLLREMDQPVVMTSGNATEEPQCIHNQDAQRRMKNVADYFLFHDREIVNRVDDSVIRVMVGGPRVIRRARGYAPRSLQLPAGFESIPPIFALGGEMKNTFCLVQNNQAVVSQHIGELSNLSTWQDYLRNIDLYRSLYQHQPERLAVDLHPEYLSTKKGMQWSEEQRCNLDRIQHHHAHFAACLAENGVPINTGPVLGIVLDGLGYGDDGTLWGGEFLLGDYRGYERRASFKPVPLLGGNQASREPWRNLYSHIRASMGWDGFKEKFSSLSLTRFLEEKPLRAMNVMMEKGINCPSSSSCGRLFDAVAAALNIHPDRIHYDGQAAMELEARVDEPALKDEVGYRDYSLGWIRNQSSGLKVLDPAPMWAALFQDLKDEVPVPVIAARFHRGLARSLVSAVQDLSGTDGNENFDTIALSGGVFQNRILLELVMQGLQGKGFKVLGHRHFPANDGGISLGQAMVSAARIIF